MLLSFLKYILYSSSFSGRLANTFKRIFFIKKFSLQIKIVLDNLFKRLPLIQLENFKIITIKEKKQLSEYKIVDFLFRYFIK